MIKYSPKQEDNEIIVFLENKAVGSIREVPDGYQYFPIGRRYSNAEVYETLVEVKHSLEKE